MGDFLYVAGSDGNNLDLAENLKEVGEKLGGTHELVNLVALDLPLYSTKAEKNGIPDSVIALTEKFQKAKGLILIAPEYNGSMPPTVNNAIAWISRSGGDDWREGFSGKFAVVATHSGGGGIKVLAAMRSQLEHLGTNVIARQIQTNFGKTLNPESAVAVMKELMTVTGVL